MNKLQKVAIYCRVDIGGNPAARRQALEAQKIALTHFAQIQGLQVVGYYEDDGYSGHDMERPGLKRLLDAYGTGAFESVLVFNHNRLYRGSSWTEPQWPFNVCSLNQPERIPER